MAYTEFRFQTKHKLEPRATASKLPALSSAETFNIHNSGVNFDCTPVSQISQQTKVGLSDED